MTLGREANSPDADLDPRVMVPLVSCLGDTAMGSSGSGLVRRLC